MQGTKSVQVHWLCSSFRIRSTHSARLWVHLRNWFSLTKVNTAYLHAFVPRIWGSYSNDPSLPRKSVPWPDFSHWFHWFPPTWTHPHVVGVVFPVEGQTQLIRLCPLPPVPEVGLPHNTVCGSVRQNSSLHLPSLSAGWKLQKLVWFSLSPCTGCVTKSVLKGVWPAPSSKTPVL